MKHDASTHGNAVFLVLIGVFLFAALSFVLTKDWHGTDTTSPHELARIQAEEIVQYGIDLRTVIDRMLLVEGASDTNDSGTGVLFAAAGADAAYGVVGAQPATEVFHASGGKLTYQTPSPDACLSACKHEFSGQYTVTGTGDNAKSELAMLVIDLKKSVCEKANSIVNPEWSSIPAGGTLTLTRFNGTNYGDMGGANPVTLTGAGNVFVGKRAFCYRESAGGQRYIYLHVVRAR